MAVDTYLLEVMGNIVFDSALSYSATMKLIDDNIIGKETLVPHYQTVKLIFERYQVLKLIRDCSNPTRFERLRGFRVDRAADGAVAIGRDRRVGGGVGGGGAVGGGARGLCFVDALGERLGHGLFEEGVRDAAQH